MIMKNSDIHTDEDYRKVIKTRMWYAVILAILGIVAFVVTMFSENLFGISTDSHQVSFYSGIGFGLIAGGVALFVKNMLLLKNKEKLRTSRIKNTDERIQSISSKAWISAGLILFISIYLVGLIGGLFYPILIKVMLLLVAIFLLSYFITYRIYAAKS